MTLAHYMKEIRDTDDPRVPLFGLILHSDRDSGAVESALQDDLLAERLHGTSGERWEIAVLKLITSRTKAPTFRMLVNKGREETGGRSGEQLQALLDDVFDIRDVSELPQFVMFTTVPESEETEIISCKFSLDSKTKDQAFEKMFLIAEASAKALHGIDEENLGNRVQIFHVVKDAIAHEKGVAAIKRIAPGLAKGFFKALGSLAGDPT